MFDSIIKFLESNYGAILSGGGILFMIISKFFSTDKAGPIVSKIQKFFDGLAKLAEWIAKILGEILKSDGFLGRK